MDRQLAALQDDLNRLQEQIRRSRRLATLGTSTAMIAHEINNLMTPILGYARFALSRNDPDLTTKALETALAQTEKVIDISERVLGMAIDRPAVRESVPVADVVDEAVKCLCRDLSKDGIRLETHIAPRLCVWADAGQLQQVLLNLFLNARSALADRTGCIRIEAEAEGDQTVIKVSDDGRGIEPEHLGNIFDAFFTTGTRSNGSACGGTGLGLAICRDIIEEHGGTIAVQSEPGRGSTFTLTLPSKG